MGGGCDLVDCDEFLLGLFEVVFRRSLLGFHGEATTRQARLLTTRNGAAGIFLWVF